jgi:NADH-quinone oxidoreductase subunit C
MSTAPSTERRTTRPVITSEPRGGLRLSSGTDTQGALAEEASAPDPRRQPFLDRFRAALGATPAGEASLVGSEIDAGDLWVRVAAGAWRQAVTTARDLGMTYFCFLSAVDWMQADLGGEKLWDPGAGAPAAASGDDAPTDDAPTEDPPTDDAPADSGPTNSGPADAGPAGAGGWSTGRAGGATRFQVLCRLYDVRAKFGMTLKADLDDHDPRVDSLVPVFRGADWHEREAWEMYGIDFAGHPGLRHIYLPAEFEGFPLRKDFPLLAREVKPWPGLVDVEPLPGEAAAPSDAEGTGAEGGEGDG